MSDTRDGERITVYADYVCPFCYLGRRSLQQYQDGRETPLTVEWHPFDLRAGKRGPDGAIDHSVDDGKDDEYFEQARENVRRLQERYGVEMAQELFVEVDSLPAQVASYYVMEHDEYEQWRRFDWALYDALWQDGLDIGDPDVLADVAGTVGVDPAAVRDALEDDPLREELTRRFETARKRGISGVPTFVYDGRAARGAVPPAQLRRLVEEA